MEEGFSHSCVSGSGVSEVVEDRGNATKKELERSMTCYRVDAGAIRKTDEIQVEIPIFCMRVSMNLQRMAK